jgi:hypothetical protein
VSRLERLAPLVVLALGALWHLGGLPQYAAQHDLLRQDEGSYLRLGIQAVTSADLPGELAPLYCLWLRSINAITGDSISTYYVSSYLTSLLLPLAWYGLARSFRITPLWAGVSALAWLFAEVNLEAIRVGSFACIVVWLFVMAARKATDVRAQWALVTSGLLLAGYVRPELFGAAFAIVPIAAWHLWREQGGRAVATALVAPAVLGMLLVAAFDLPLGGARSDTAWHQHFAQWIAQREGLDKQAWNLDFKAFLRQRGLFVPGVLSLAVQHPLLLAKFTLSNVSELALLRSWDTLAPAGAWVRSSYGLAALPLLLSAGAGLIWRSRRPRSTAPAHWPSYAALAFAALVALAGCLLLHPWPRHVVPAWALLLIVILPRRDEASHGRALMAAVAVGLLAVVVPRSQPPAWQHPKAVESAVRLLRAQVGGQSVAVFSNFSAFGNYLAPPGVNLPLRVASDGFEAMLTRRRPAAVVLTPSLARVPLLQRDAGFKQFREAPERFGYRCEPSVASIRVCIAHPMQPASEHDRRDGTLLAPSE